MDSGTKQESPPIIIGLSSSPVTHVPSNPLMLSPVTLKSDRRWSVGSSSDEDSFQPIPPSPTPSSQSSSYLTSSTALREKKNHDGANSLALLNPSDNSHAWRPLNATTTIDDATVDHHPLYPASSHVITSVGSTAHTLDMPTPTYAGSAAEGRQDEPIDPTPFAFGPYYLASLVDPRNLESLQAIGGIEGLLAGLGTSPASGLKTSGTKSKPGGTSVTAVTPSTSEEFTHQSGAYTGTVEDRQRVYGSNVLPVHKSKTLLELMWLTLKDKVLVSLYYSRVH